MPPGIGYGKEALANRRKRGVAKKPPALGLSAEVRSKGVAKPPPETAGEATERRRKKRKSFGGYVKMLATGRPD